MGKFCEVLRQGRGLRKQRQAILCAVPIGRGPNTQKVRVLVKGVPTRMTVCTRRLRSNKVERGIIQSPPCTRQYRQRMGVRKTFAHQLAVFFDSHTNVEYYFVQSAERFVCPVRSWERDVAALR